MNPDKRKLLSDNGAAASSKYNEDDDEDDNNEDADEEDDLSSNHVDVSDYINMMCSNFAVVESFDSKDSSFSQDSGEDSREFVVGFYDEGGKEKFEMLLLRKKDLTTDGCRCPNSRPVCGSGNNEACVGREETFPSCSCALEEYNELVQQNNSKCFDEEVSCESEDESQTVTGNDVETKEKDVAMKWRPDEYNSLVYTHNTEQFDEAEQAVTSDGEAIDETVHDGNHKCNRHDKEECESDSGLQTNHDSGLDEKTSSCSEANPAKASYPSGDFGAIYVPINKISVEDRSLEHLRDKSERQSGSRLIKSKSAKHPSAVLQGSETSDRVAVEAGFEDRFDCWKPRQFDSISDYPGDSRNASIKKFEDTGDYISSYSNIERNPLYFQAMSTPNSVKRIFPCYNLMPCDNDVDIEPPLLSQSHSGLRHRRKRKDVEVTISNEVPDYMGDRDVEEVLLFIYGKETQNAVSSKTDLKSSGLTGKTDKKKKKKKHHHSKHNKNQAEKPDQSGKNPVSDKDGHQLSDHVNTKNENKQEREHCSHVVPDQVNNFSGDGSELKHCKGGKPSKAETKGCSSRAKKKKAGGKIDAGSTGHLPQQQEAASHVPLPDCDDDFLLRLSYLSEDEKVKTTEQNFTLVANKKSKKLSAKLSDKADDFAVALSNKLSSTRSSSHLPNIQSSYASFKSCSSNDSVNASTGLSLGSNDERDSRGSQPTLGNDSLSTSALRVSVGQDATTAASKHDNGQTKKKTKEMRTDVQKSSSGTKKQTKQLDSNKQLMKFSNEVQSCPATLDYAALDDIVLSSVVCEANSNEAENRRSFQISGGSETSSTNSNISLQQCDRSCSPSEMPVSRIFVDSIADQLAAIPCVCFNESRCSDHGNSAELDQNFCEVCPDASLSDSNRFLQDGSVKSDALVASPDKANAHSSFKSGNRATSLDPNVSKPLQLPSKESVAFSEFQVEPENVLPEGTKTSSGIDLSMTSSIATVTQGTETPGMACNPMTIANGDLDDGISSTSSASPIMGQKKPVVFLDTKQTPNARSHDMGITFGFDANTGDDSSAKSESLSSTSLQSCSVMQSHSDCLPCDCIDEETSEKTDSDFFLGMSDLHQNGYRVPHLCKPTYLVYPNGHLFSGAPLTYIPYVPFIPPGLGFSPHMGPPVGVVPPMIIRSTEDDDDGDDVIRYKMNSHDGCGPNPGNLSNNLTSVEMASSMPIHLPLKTAETASVRGKLDGNFQRFSLSQAVRYVHREYEKVLKKVTQSSNCPVVWYSSDHDN